MRNTVFAFTQKPKKKNRVTTRDRVRDKNRDRISVAD